MIEKGYIFQEAKFSKRNFIEEIENRIKEVTEQRRRAGKIMGILHTPCDFCGGYVNVMADCSTRTCECAICAVKRIIKEEYGTENLES